MPASVEVLAGFCERQFFEGLAFAPGSCCLVNSAFSNCPVFIQADISNLVEVIMDSQDCA
jgi:hypothetical protein